jgi:hypothetical protein
MAEVIDHWPNGRKRQPQRFFYPWDQWMDVDENGHGDIWLATAGIDFPAESNASRFRSILYDRANNVNRQRRDRAPVRVMRIRGTDKVRRVLDYTPIKVKAKIVSDSQIAFQFYEGDEAPPEPEVTRVAVPKRRTPIRQAVTRRTLEKASI